MREVWIGLVGVSPRQGVDLLGDAKGAWVNVLAFAANGAEYCRVLEVALEHYGLDQKAIENLEPLSKRLLRSVVDPELLRLAKEVASTGFARFGPFHTFASEDRDSKPPIQ